MGRKEPGGAPTKASGVTLGRRRYSRRAVLAAGAAGAAGTVAAGIGAFVLLRGSDSDSPAADSTPGSVTPGPSPGVTADPHPGFAAVRFDDAAWNRLDLATGEPIAFEHGACFIDTKTGAIEVLQLAGLAAGAAHGGLYRTSGDGKLVAVEIGAERGQEPAAGIYDRTNRRAIAWDPTVLRLHLLDRRMFAFGALASDPTYGPGAYAGNTYVAGRCYMTTADLEPVGEFDLGPDITESAYRSALSNDGRTLIMAGGTRFVPVIVNVEQAEMREAETPAEPSQLTSMASVGPGDGSSTVSAVYFRQDDSRTRVTWDADGKIIDETTETAVGEDALLSPDGDWRLSPGTLRNRSWGIGDQENWVYTELSDTRSSATAFRVLSGWLEYGLGIERRWLADSSAFLVTGADAAAPVDDYVSWRTNRAYYLVSTEGRLENLPAVPATLTGSRDDARSNWGYYAYFGGPEPAPDDPDLMVFGRRAVFNRRTGEWLGPGTGPSPFEQQDPWQFGSSEAFFTFPNIGHDYASPGTILPPVVDVAPFRDEVTLTVARAGNCLNLRERPAGGAEIVDCMPDGTRLTVADPRYLLDQGWQFPDGPPAFWSDDVDGPRQMYVYVEQSDGERGWAAIQYLDWAGESAT